MPSASQLVAMKRFFSPAIFREMAETGRSPLFSRLLNCLSLAEHKLETSTVGEAFDAAFDFMKISGLRDEYVYRAALIRSILIGRHSLRTASMLSEFRAGACKADIVILNGTGTAYEIKSERDTLTRLQNQVENYAKVFAKTYVITSEVHACKVLEYVPEAVGIMMLGDRSRISTIREAEDRADRVCPVTIFHSLRMTEALEVLRSMGVDVPNFPNTQRCLELRRIFETLDPAKVHFAMVQTLKRTRDLAPLSKLVDGLPRSLHATALSVQIRRADHARILKAVSTPLSVALAWN